MVVRAVPGCMGMPRTAAGEWVLPEGRGWLGSSSTAALARVLRVEPGWLGFPRAAAPHRMWQAEPGWLGFAHAQGVPDWKGSQQSAMLRHPPLDWVSGGAKLGC
mmetsp:Transcript_122500/g.357698  ORF Transcript_122500/g.357698 Transcript_122500/m.357698 type:complete len:104 (-) Transcript_122500:446-757(-)